MVFPIANDNIEHELGRARYLAFYFLCGILASVAHVALNTEGPGAVIPSLGASGAISGAMGGLHASALESAGDGAAVPRGARRCGLRGCGHLVPFPAHQRPGNAGRHGDRRGVRGSTSVASLPVPYSPSPSWSVAAEVAPGPGDGRAGTLICKQTTVVKIRSRLTPTGESICAGILHFLSMLVWSDRSVFLSINSTLYPTTKSTPLWRLTVEISSESRKSASRSRQM